MPLARSPREGSRVAARASTSMPAVGSSRMASSGRPTRARASPTRCRSPPDSTPIACPRGRAGQPDEAEQLVDVRAARRGTGRGGRRPRGRSSGDRSRRRPGASGRPAPGGPVRPGAGSMPRTRTVAAVRPSVALEDLDRGRLAGAVRPEQREHLAGRDVEREPAQDGPAVVAPCGGRRPRPRLRHRRRPSSAAPPPRRPRGPSPAARDHPELPLEIGVEDLADLDRAEDSLAIDEVALRAGRATW